MLHINRVTLLGRAGRDPEVRTLRSGDRTASFSLATTEKWTDREGQPAEATEWHRVVVYGGAVKTVEAMVRKGVALMVEGRVATRAFEDKGRTRHVTEVVVAGPQGLVNVLSPRPHDTSAPAGAADESGGSDADGDAVA